MKTTTSNRNKLISLLLASLMLILSGCAGNGDTSYDTYSGWLGVDYSLLRADSEHQNAKYWTADGDKFQPYTKIMIDPVSQFKNSSLSFNTTQEFIDETTEYFKLALENQFSQQYELVSEPGPDVLRIRTAITGAELYKPVVTARNLIPVALVVNLAKEATGNRKRMAVISMEAEAFDSLTNEHIAMVVQEATHETKTQKPQQLKANTMFATLDLWSEKARQRFYKIRNNQFT